MLKLFLNEPAFNVTRDEPYKLENLYQSPNRNVMSG